MHWFGEVAADGNFHKAIVSGVMISVSPRMDMSFFHRNISMKYQSLFGKAFTESALPGNESGMFTGISLRPFDKWQVNAYTDLFSFPWLRFRADAPGKGADHMIQIAWRPDKRSELVIRYRSESKPLNESHEFPELVPVKKTKQQLRLHFASQLNPTTSFKSRVDLNWYNNKNVDAEHGFSGFVEVASRPSEKIKWNSRIHYFETDGYNSRLYAFESGVPYSFSIPAFYDRGMRYYLNLGYEPFDKLGVWIKLARTIFFENQLSHSHISPNRSNLDIQVAYNF